MSDGVSHEPSSSPRTVTISTMVGMIAGTLLLFSCGSGVLHTLWFGLDSERAGTTAALVVGPTIGFALGGFAGSLISHFGFKGNDHGVNVRLGVPLVGALIGTTLLFAINGIFFGWVFPEL